MSVTHTRTTKPKKIALGMSGGVDSSLCAHLLKEQGYEVTGIYLECWRAPGCRTEEDRKDALKVALELDIPFQVLDFKNEYKEKVVEYFFSEYEAGRTPNPDVACNKEIKFGLFYDWAMENGFDYVATGHYAKIESINTKPQLLIPKDTFKDQTYFLYRLNQEQLNHILFPLGNFTKQEVRVEAEKRNLHVASKKDSVGICFIGDIDVHNFLFERLGENPGEVIDSQGNVTGEHKGLWFYTIGQRHGFTINSITSIKQSDGTTINKHNIPPFYVIKKLPESNQLMVGFGAETYSTEIKVADLHLISPPNSEKIEKLDNLFVRIRHTGKLIPCEVKQTESKLIVYLKNPTQGIAEGQSAVFYHQQSNKDLTEYRCLGGAIIVG